MWQSRTKSDLIIEVWEKLDCESVGAKEISDIETVVREEYGDSAVESPMIIARSSPTKAQNCGIPRLWNSTLNGVSESPYDAVFRNVLQFSDFKQTLISIRRLENIRKKFKSENDREGLRQCCVKPRSKENAAPK